MLHLEKVREVKRYTPRESEELAFSLEGASTSISTRTSVSASTSISTCTGASISSIFLPF